MRDLLDADARALLGQRGSTGANEVDARHDVAWVPCGGEMLQLQTSCPAPHSLMRDMPFLFLLPLATMDDCGVRPLFIGNDEVLEECEDALGPRARLAQHGRSRASALQKVLCSCATGSVDQAALCALLHGQPTLAPPFSSEEMQMFRVAEPAALEALVRAIGASDRGRDIVAQLAESLLRDVLTHLVAQRGGRERTLFPELSALLRCLLISSGATHLSAEDFALFLELTFRSPGQPDAVDGLLAMSAAETYVELATFTGC